MYRVLSLLIFVVLVSASYGIADQIQMKNGDRLTGTIINSDSETIVLRTSYAGEITLSLGAVEQVVLDPPLYASLTDGRTPIFTGLPSGNAEGQSQIIEAAQSPQSGGSVSQQTTTPTEPELPKTPGWLDLWVGGVDTNFNLTRGNSETINIGVGGDVTRTTDKTITNLILAYVFSRDSTFGSSQTTANAIRSGARLEYRLNKQFNIFTFNNLEHDPFQDLNLRVVLGAGYGWYIRKDAKTQFQLYAGGSYNRENFVDQIRNSGELLTGEKFSHKLTDRIALIEGFEFFPNITDYGEFRWTLNSGLTVGLTKILAWQLTLSDRYLSNPSIGRDRNDLILTTGFRIAVVQ